MLYRSSNFIFKLLLFAAFLVLAAELLGSDHFVGLSLVTYRLANQMRSWNCYLCHSAGMPDELGYCFDFASGKASGMEELA